jgi:hypothetical protein
VKLMRPATQLLQMSAGSGEIGWLLKNLIIERQHLVGADDKSIEMLAADGLGLGAGQNLGDIGGLDAALIGLQSLADGALVDIGGRDGECQAGGIQHLPARAAS